MSWFKRDVGPSAEPVVEAQSDVQLAVDSLVSSGRFYGCDIAFTDTTGGFEVTGIPTDDADLWVAAVAFVENLTDSRFSRSLAGGGLLFVHG